jgi:hypothetical protein
MAAGEVIFAAFFAEFHEAKSYNYVIQQPFICRLYCRFWRRLATAFVARPAGD